jgi:hypothetical protein
MRKLNEKDDKTGLETLAGSAMMLAFGLGVMAFLIAIDRPEWFNLRPASGAAVAMSKAPSHKLNDSKSGVRGASGN